MYSYVGIPPLTSDILVPFHCCISGGQDAITANDKDTLYREPLRYVLVEAVNTLVLAGDTGPDPRLAWGRVYDHVYATVDTAQPVRQAPPSSPHVALHAGQHMRSG
jgi:hypothetical protein